jgi:hypothetical protein
MQLPNQFSKTMKFGDGVKGDSEVRREVNVFVRSIDGEIPSLDKAASADGKRNVVIMRKGEGEPLIVNTDELAPRTDINSSSEKATERRRKRRQTTAKNPR